MFEHLSNQSLVSQLNQCSVGKGDTDLESLRHHRGSDEFVVGYFLVEFVIRNLVKESDVVQLIPNFSFGPLLQRTQSSYKDAYPSKHTRLK